MILIFDLDDTLINTSELIVPKAANEACQILVQGGVLQNLDALLEERQKLAVGMSHSQIFPFMAKKYGFAATTTLQEQEKIIQRAVHAFYSPSFTDELPLIDGALENLKIFSKHFPLYLVTAGLEEAQNRKILAANIRHFFRKVFVVSSITEKSKSSAFQEILRIENCLPTDCLSIGNRLSSEIHDAKKIGMKTCHFRFGEHKEETPQSPEEIPDFTIVHQKELLKICPIPLGS